GVVDVVLGRHLVNHSDVASVHDFFVKHSRGRFVLLFSHVVFLLKSPSRPPLETACYITTPVPRSSRRTKFGRYPAAPTSHPKVFGEADNESLRWRNSADTSRSTPRDLVMRLERWPSRAASWNAARTCTCSSSRVRRPSISWSRTASMRSRCRPHPIGRRRMESSTRCGGGTGTTADICG